MTLPSNTNIDVTIENIEWKCFNYSTPKIPIGMDCGKRMGFFVTMGRWIWGT